MKKVSLFFVLSLLGFFTASAQLIQVKNDKCKSKSKVSTSAVARQVAPSGSNHSMSVLWADDFSTPSTWVIDSVPGTIGNWAIGFNPPSGNFPIDPINSASVGNGFALFDSDLICSHDQIGNLTTANPINLSGHPYVRLSFSQYYRRFHDSTYVFISTNGTSWTKFEVNGNITVGGYSANDINVNPDITSIDISAVAGNQDSVYVRFQFYSPDTNMTTVDTSAGCGYAWMLDDISIYDVPLTDGALMQGYCGEYTVLPTIQAEAFKMRGRIINNGVSAFTGAKIYFAVNDPIGTVVYTDSSVASGTLNPGDTSAFLESTGSYLPMSYGLYFVDQTLSVPGDSDNTNDLTTGFIVMDDSTYARDFTALDVTDYAGTVGFSSPISFGEIFHIYNASEFTSVSFYLNSPKLGGSISASIYNAPGGIPGSLLGTTPTYSITPDDTGGAFITLPFPTWLTANTGDYFVAVNQLDTNNMTLGLSNNVYTFHAGFYKITTNWTVMETSNLKFALMLRVNNPAGTLLGVKESPVQTGFNVYPNPASGMVYISGNGSVEKEVTINVVNGLGQIVKTAFYNSFMNGRMDLSEFPAGIYTMNIRTATGEVNKSIILE